MSVGCFLRGPVAADHLLATSVLLVAFAKDAGSASWSSGWSYLVSCCEKVKGIAVPRASNTLLDNLC